MKKGAFCIPIRELSAGPRAYDLAVTVPWLLGALEGCEMQPAGVDGTLQVELTQTGSDVLVRGSVRVELSIPCARCLDPIALKPEGDIALLLVPSPDAPPGPSGSGKSGHVVEPKARRDRSSRTAHAAPTERDKRDTGDDEVEFTAEDAEADTYDGEEIVLDPFVREAILLEIPLFPLCSEGCEGIRPPREQAEGAVAGTPEIDPRLMPLLELSRKRTIKE